MKGFLLAAGVAFAIQQPQVFRTGVDIVEVDVVVYDKTGAFVADLAMDDFEVQENGAPQRVEQLYLHLRSSPPTNGARAGSSSPSSLAQPATARRTFVVVFDSDHMTPGGFKRTQQAALSPRSRLSRPAPVRPSSSAPASPSSPTAMPRPRCAARRCGSARSSSPAASRSSMSQPATPSAGRSSPRPPAPPERPRFSSSSPRPAT